MNEPHEMAPGSPSEAKLKWLSRTSEPCAPSKTREKTMWTDEEEREALHLALHGWPRYAIADQLKRSRASVGAKLRRLWKRGDTYK